MFEKHHNDSRMRIGVVTIHSKPYVEEALRKLGHVPVVIQLNDENVAEKISHSDIKKWIFSGSDLRVTVNNPLAPQVPMEILEMKDKEFFLICYSMESMMLQLGYPVVKRAHFVTERFQLGPLQVYRNHGYYIPAKKVNKKVKVLNTRKGEVMTVSYKNLIMTQWHPERTKDGIQCLNAWIGCV
jgi:GMP synthase-like glutamine amidotransferase